VQLLQGEFIIYRLDDVQGRLLFQLGLTHSGETDAYSGSVEGDAVTDVG